MKNVYIIMFIFGIIMKIFDEIYDAKILLEYGQIFKLSADDSSVRKNPEFKALMKRREQITRLIAQEKNPIMKLVVFS